MTGRFQNNQSEKPGGIKKVLDPHKNDIQFCLPQNPTSNKFPAPQMFRSLFNRPIIPYYLAGCL